MYKDISRLSTYISCSLIWYELYRFFLIIIFSLCRVRRNNNFPHHGRQTEMEYNNITTEIYVIIFSRL